MRSHLTVDIDYFCGHHRAPLAKEKLAIRDTLGKMCKALPKITVIRDHHHVLPLLRKKHDILVNVDYHDDLAQDTDTVLGYLNCGTWASFVRWRNRAKYLWINPSHGCLDWDTGICAGGGVNLWKEDRDMTSWKLLEHKTGLAYIPWNTVETGSVCLSPGFTSEENVLFSCRTLAKEAEKTGTKIVVHRMAKKRYENYV